jgi:SAM-dependent methyltransferase
VTPSDSALVVRTGATRSLLLNGVSLGDDSPRGLEMEDRMGRLPARLHPSAERVLAIGLGTGITAAALAAELPHAQLAVVERSPAVLDAARPFRDRWAVPLDGPRIRLLVADGRDFLLQTAGEACFDLIAGDLIAPAGSERLFSLPFYRLCRDRLTAGGVLTQWLPLFQIPPPMLRRVVGSFLAVFPAASLWLVAFDAFKPVALLAGAKEGTFLISRLRRPEGCSAEMRNVPFFAPSRAARLLDAVGLRRFAGDAVPLDDGETLVAGREAVDGLADGGLANLESLLAGAGEMDPVVSTYLSAGLSHRRGDLSAALAGFRHVMAAWPDDPLLRLDAADASASVLIEHALALRSHGDLSGAEAALRRAIATAPDRLDAHELLARLTRSTSNTQHPTSHDE